MDGHSAAIDVASRSRPSVPRSDGVELIEKALRVLERHDPRLGGWRMWVDSDALHVDLPIGVDRKYRTLRFEPAHDGAAWGRTPSFNVVLRGDAPLPLPADEDKLLRQVLTLVERRDRGGLALPLSDRPVDTLAVERDLDEAAVAVRNARAEVARAELADTLHFASFIAYKAITTEDLYPHVGPLGDTMSTPALLDGWRDTVERIKEGTAPQKLGLYIHIPFCTVACTFCFCAKTDKFTRQGFDAYTERLIEEIELFAPVFTDATFTSVYFGGGTPSLLPPPAMKRLFDALYAAFDVPEGTQVIFEGNPDSLSERKIEVLAREGRVTRLTIGVQTLDAAVQEQVRRFNKPHHVADALSAARAHGIAHVNVDLMAGLPAQTLASFKQDLEFLLSLEPDSIHLNAYRPLPRVSLVKGGEELSPERVELRDEMMAWATERLASAGHLGKMGQGSRRTADAANLQEYDLRRQNSSLLGLGFPSRAHAFGNFYYIPDTRRGFDGGLAATIESGPTWQAVPADDEEERHKYLVENLRTGFARAEFREIFGMDCLEAAPQAFRDLERLGVIEIDEHEVRSFTGTHADNATYRVLLYSPAFLARARRGWGAEYDRDKDYHALLRGLVEGF